LVELPIGSYPHALSGDVGQESGYSYAAAQAMMWLSQLAYEQDVKIDALLGQWQLQLVAHLHSPTQGKGSYSATQGYVCRRDATTFVVFAGTDPGVVKTVLTDGKTWPDPSGVHPGFRAALDAVWPQLLEAVASPGRGRLLVAGHSLGAALAVLAAADLQNRAGIVADAVYGFGLPRVGGTQFGASYEPVLGARTFRLVNGDDPVPSVPPPLLGFRHVGRSLFCPYRGSFGPLSVPAAEPDDLPTFVKVQAGYVRSMTQDVLKGRWPVPAQPGVLGWLYGVLPAGLADHMPARYLRALGTPVR
jgi:hypothetical protein